MKSYLAGLLTAVRHSNNHVAVTNHVAEVVPSMNYSLAYGGSTPRPHNSGVIVSPYGMT